MNTQDEADNGKSLAVGYKRPPRHSQFKKGVSGNPKGRPRKQAPSAALPVLGRISAGLILNEVTRPMQIRENGKAETMPAVQAILRSLIITALKGDRRAAISVVRMAKTAEETVDREITKSMDELYLAQRQWDEEVRQARLHGLPLDEPVPHPYDMAFDQESLQIIANGPTTRTEKERWDRALIRRQDTVEEIEDLLALSSPETDSSLSNVLSTLVATIDAIDGIYPDEHTRRQAGFNLQNWRAAQGVQGKLLRDLKRPWDPRYWAKVKARREPPARGPTRK